MKLAIAILVVGAVVGAAVLFVLQEKGTPAETEQAVAQPGSGESTGVPPVATGKGDQPRFKIEYCGG